MKHPMRTFGVALLALAIAGAVFAQQRWGGRRGGYGRGPQPDEMDLTKDRHGVPTWDVDPNFKSDVFTFVRIKYSSQYRGWSWTTDYPDSDLNFPFRLQELTSLKVDPTPKILELTDEALFDYPWIYMLEVGGLEFSDAEVSALRHYLMNGGFLMVDDFWGEQAWEHFHEQMQRVFPDREPVDLPIDHPIFHCVFDLKEKPQVPGINVALAYQGTGITWERPDAKEVHYRAYFDDKGRMMAIICQNTDLGDGWEREGESEWYFHEFSEKKAYPMGVNIVFYAMTH